jgi:hypothetical protein
LSRPACSTSSRPSSIWSSGSVSAASISPVATASPSHATPALRSRHI